MSIFTRTQRPNAKLPDSMLEPTIERLDVGRHAFTLPWAVWADMDGNLWINGKYPVTSEPMGTSRMHIRREHDGVVIISGMERMSRQESHAFVGGHMYDMLPVVEDTDQ